MDNTFEYRLSIAGLSVLIDTDRCLPWTESFLPFYQEKEEQEPSCRAVFRQTDKLPSFPEQILHAERAYRIHGVPEGAFRSFYDEQQGNIPYAAARISPAHNLVEVEYLREGSRFVSGFRNSFFHIGLESLLIRNRRLCLHAACVETQFGGLLFSGVSGIGKSTQADLWCRYRNARQINGDRPILSKTDTGWLAWGSPYAGSSEVYENRCCSVAAIIMLRQSDSCSIRRLRPMEAFREVWKGITMQPWDPEFTETASDLTMDLIQNVPVYEYSCTPDQNAVVCLEDILRKK